MNVYTVSTGICIYGNNLSRIVPDPVVALDFHKTMDMDYTDYMGVYRNGMYWINTLVSSCMLHGINVQKIWRCGLQLSM